MKFQDLQIWQKGMAIVKIVYQETRNFPTEEKFGLVSQMRRCAVSIPSNIAEGNARKSSKELKQFIVIARGSLAELETQVIIAEDLGFLNNEKLKLEIQELYKMLHSFSEKIN
ncbi:MAG: four helix bundle protein [Candidatus Peregrinibacteria bacterium]|nr:four helix bundle protein [Candidatus Peregrinibacteria bacterium]